MASVIVVDNEFKDSLKDYGQIIDSINGSEEFSQSLECHIDNNEVKNHKELLDLVYGSTKAEILSKLADKELESTFNLILYLAVQITKSIEEISCKDSPLIKNLCELNPVNQPSLRDRKSIKSTTIISILTTIFNLLPKESPNRIVVLSTLMEIVEISKVDFLLIQDSIGPNLISWLSSAQAPESEIISLFWRFIALDAYKSSNSLELIKSFNSKFDLDKERLRSMALFALSSKVVDVSFLVNKNVSKAIKENADDEVVNLFHAYVRGDLISSVPSSIPTELSSEIQQKSKILNLARFFSESDKSVFEYSEIPSELASNNHEFEFLLMSSIKANVIEGKLDQLKQTFSLNRVNIFILAGDDDGIKKNWERVRKALSEWKHALENIDEIVKTSKENIVNNNSS